MYQHGRPINFVYESVKRPDQTFLAAIMVFPRCVDADFYVDAQVVITGAYRHRIAVPVDSLAAAVADYLLFCHHYLL